MNKNKYFIREKSGTMVEVSSLAEIAHMIDQGRLTFMRKKFRRNRVVTHFTDHTESAIVIEVHRHYERVNREPRAKEVCTKPCCSYGGTGR